VRRPSDASKQPPRATAVTALHVLPGMVMGAGQPTVGGPRPAPNGSRRSRTCLAKKLNHGQHKRKARSRADPQVGCRAGKSSDRDRPDDGGEGSITRREKRRWGKVGKEATRGAQRWVSGRRTGIKGGAPRAQVRGGGATGEPGLKGAICKLRRTTRVSGVCARESGY